ncbi:MAG: NFACT RNA binding domain-containing protein, partial [Nanoarchaeota archaeon]
PETTIKEVADATCTFSRAWKLGLQSSEVFYVSPEQVSKKTKAGEYMGKGAFMVYGKSNYVANKVNLAVGITKDRAVMAGPLEAIKKNCDKFVVLRQGDEKVSTIAKKINYKLGSGLDLDGIIRALPAGSFKLE